MQQLMKRGESLAEVATFTCPGVACLRVDKFSFACVAVTDVPESTILTSVCKANKSGRPLIGIESRALTRRR
jgi:hypothetical protein